MNPYKETQVISELVNFAETFWIKKREFSTIIFFLAGIGAVLSEGTPLPALVMHQMSDL